MTPSDPDRFPDDLQAVARLLRDNRPEASALELDAVKRQVRNRSTRPSQKGSPSMKSRIAMTAMLVTGLLMSGTGAGLAVSGLGQSENATSAQYNKVAPTTAAPPTTKPEGGTLPTTTESTPPTAVPEETDSGSAPESVQNTTPDSAPDAAPATADEPTTREQAAQPARQAEAAGGEELPFTGLAAVPILVGGIALLGGGLVLRRRTA